MDILKTKLIGVDKALITRIKKICIYGVLGDEILFITDTDDVYSMGYNYMGCLGVGDIHSRTEPVKIPELCKKNIKQISCK